MRLRFSPLRGASANGHVEIVKLLLDKKADINAAEVFATARGLSERARRGR